MRLGLPLPPPSFATLLATKDEEKERNDQAEEEEEYIECLVCMEDLEESNAVAILPPPPFSLLSSLLSHSTSTSASTSFSSYERKDKDNKDNESTISTSIYSSSSSAMTERETETATEGKGKGEEREKEKEVDISSTGWTWRFCPYCENCVKILLERQFEDYVRQLESVTCEKEQRSLLARGPPINLHDCNGFNIKNWPENENGKEKGKEKDKEEIGKEQETEDNEDKEDKVGKEEQQQGQGRSLDREQLMQIEGMIETNTDGGYGEVYSLYYFSDQEIHSAKVQGSLVGDERKRFIDQKRCLLAALNEERESKK